MALLELHNITRNFGLKTNGFVVLQDISFEVDEREFVCIVGPSGCGKSTLLRIIVGLDRANGGRVLYRGR